MRPLRQLSPGLLRFFKERKDTWNDKPAPIALHLKFRRERVQGTE